jgi:hypothetical protein
MTKFFAQLLLSVFIALGAAAGFDPDVKGELTKTWDAAKAFLSETAETAAGMDGDLSAGMGANAAVQAEFDAGYTSETPDEKHKGFDLGALFDGVHDLLPASSLNGSVSAEAESEAEIGSAGTNLDLEGGVESGLGISLGN